MNTDKSPATETMPEAIVPLKTNQQHSPDYLSFTAAFALILDLDDQTTGIAWL